MSKISKKKYYESNRKQILERKREKYKQQKSQPDSDLQPKLIIAKSSKQSSQQSSQQISKQSSKQSSQQNQLKHRESKMKIISPDNNTPKSVETAVATQGLDYYEALMCLLLSVLTVVVMGFCYLQTLPLYTAGGFDSPALASLGALLLVASFGGIKALKKRSLWTSLLCLAVCGYEVLFIYQASLASEQKQSKQQVELLLQDDSKLQVLAAKQQASKELYQTRLKKYQDPSNKVYQNAWFKKTYLTPALNSWQEASTVYETSKQTRLQQVRATMPADLLALKVSYRLGLVILLMIFCNLLITHTRIFLTSNKAWINNSFRQLIT